MNRKNINILLVGLCVIFTACQDDWLDREPLDQVTEAAFFKSPNDFTVYVNRFHPSTGGTYSRGDTHTDVMIMNNSAPERIGGQATIHDGPGYNYADIRRVNYLLEQTRKWEGEFDDIQQVVGEAHYFRAFFYWGLLRNFGDVQWIESVLTMESPELFGARDPRNVVADNILADLDTAAMYLMEDRGDGYSRLPKWFALLLQSRVALYEGTWQKYHQGTPFGVPNADPDKYLAKAVAAARQIMDSNLYGLYTTGDPQNDYYNTFNRRDFSTSPETMRWTKMDMSQNITAHRKLYTLARFDNSGITKQFVEQYLCIDGLPIGVSPLYQGDNTIEDEAKNRDPRFKQTIFTNDAPLYVHEDGSIEYYEDAFKRSYQDIGHSSPTGYQQRKNYLEYTVYHSSQEEESPTLNARYAEVLLNYAEAKAELGTLTQEDLDITINLLRDRVGMPHMQLNNLVHDPDWFFPDLSPIINEIRRERTVELFTEGFRLDDLFRWAAMKYIVGTRGKGAKADQFHHDPGLLLDENGYIDMYRDHYPNGYQFNLNRDYLWPIPESQVVLNPGLGQNPGWAN